MSKLEESLAQALDQVSRNQNAPWPYPPPIREFHPMWCCQHLAAIHLHIGGGRRMCLECEAGGDTHEYERGRAFRVDFAWPAQRVIVEVEGIRYDQQGGRHQTGSGFAKDLEKYTALELAGWRVIRESGREIASGEALALIEKALKAATAVDELDAAMEGCTCATAGMARATGVLLRSHAMHCALYEELEARA